MPVYRAQTPKKTKLRPLLILLAALLLAAVLIGASSCFDRFASGTVAEENAEEESLSGKGPLAALNKVYETSEIRGVSTVTNVVLDEQFGISSDMYLQAWGRYTNGTYGIADVFIFRMLEGHEDALREGLEQVKTNRIVECRNYDIYNSLECAESAQIFQVGDDYMCLVMIEEVDAARDIIEDCLSRR